MLIQTQKPALRPLTTAHLAQTMSLLSLNATELRQKLESELANNPALELVDQRLCPTCQHVLRSPGPCPSCSQQKSPESEEPIVFVSARDDFQQFRGSSDYAEDSTTDELTAEQIDLPTFVLRQIAPELAPEDRTLAIHILTTLDEDGLLTVAPIEIARFHHVPLSRIEKVLDLIQHAEPIGVGSPSPKEALLVQLRVLSETQKTPALADKAIQQGMDMLSRRHYSELGRLLGIPTSQAKQIGLFISENLNPYPARAHWGDIHQTREPNHDVYHIPDVLISTLGDSEEGTLVIEIISPMAGKLRINPLFRSAIQQAPEEKVDEWQSDLEHANLLIKCLQQRDNTIVRLMQRVASLQKKFILHGDTHLKPITRASLAKTLDVHESTISRAVSAKSLQLPSGKIIPLSKLFDRSLPIRTTIKNLIAEETKPLTDTQLAKLLKGKGYNIARRTVAKYRAMEGILPAHLRQQPNAQS